MLDLDRLFSAPDIADAVSSCAQAEPPKTRQENDGGAAVMASDVSGQFLPAIPSEILDASGFQENSQGCGAGDSWHTWHNGEADISAECARLKPSNHAGFKPIGTPGTPDTVVFQGTGCECTHGAPVGGGGRDRFALHQAAVVLMIGWARTIDADHEELVALLMHMGTMPPAEQVSYWYRVCIDDGLKPWQLLCLPATKEGKECSMCEHLVSRMHSGADSSTGLHWVCALGYLIQESE